MSELTSKNWLTIENEIDGIKEILLYLEKSVQGRHSFDVLSEAEDIAESLEVIIHIIRSGSKNKT